MFELSAEQLLKVGFFATILVSVFRLFVEYANKKKWDAPAWISVLVVYIVSFTLAVIWFPQTFPVFPALDPSLPSETAKVIIAYIGDWVAIVSSYSVAASVIYTVMTKKIQDKISDKIAPALPVGKKSK